LNQKRTYRKLAAILIADVEGYSRLMGDNELETVSTVTEYRQVMMDLIKQFNGRVVDSPGDNLLGEFGSVVDAVECAVKIQAEHKTRNKSLPEHRRMLFRIGINLGDVIEEGDRIYGDSINIAARLESLAAGGEICISGTAFDQVKNKLALDFQFLGEKSVKNIKDPVRAYRLGAESADSIHPAESHPKLPDRPSIAVLPIVNLSNDADQDYFSDGLTDDLITDLSKISELFVIARNSVFNYKGKTIKIDEVGRELGVRYILEGSVRKSGERVRITVQLIDTESGGHLWAERYDRELKDIFDLQDEVTQKIVATLALTLKKEEQNRLLRKGTRNLKAYDYILRGLEHFPGLTKDGNEMARQMFEKSIELDGEYALAHSLLGWTYLMEHIFGWTLDPHSIEKAYNISQKAISLDDSVPDAHAALGFVYLWKKQFDQAVMALEKTLTLNPNNADHYVTLGNILTWCGKLEEGLEMIRKGMRLNPHYPGFYLFRLGQAYCFMDKPKEAVEALNASLVRHPNYSPIRIFLAFAYIQMGRKKKARAEIDELKKINRAPSLAFLRETIPLKDPEKLDYFLECLKKAGLQ
jgi:adenylate cyclase